MRKGETMVLLLWEVLASVSGGLGVWFLATGKLIFGAISCGVAIFAFLEGLNKMTLIVAIPILRSLESFRKGRLVSEEELKPGSSVGAAVLKAASQEDDSQR